jgi:hypothetical protein
MWAVRQTMRRSIGCGVECVSSVEDDGSARRSAEGGRVSATIAFVGVVVFAFVVGRAIERFASRLLVLSGAEYVVLGVLLGPFLPLGLIGSNDIAALDPLVSTVLGAVGFFVGLRVRHVRATREAMLAGLAAALGVVLVVAAVMTQAFELLEPALANLEPMVAEPFSIDGDVVFWIWMTPVGLWVGLTVGAAAAGSSTALIDIAASRFGASESRCGLLRGMASMGELLAVFAFGLAMATTRATTAAETFGLTVVEWSFLTMTAGAFTGLLFIVFIGRDDDPTRMNVATLGVIVFAAGVGTALGVSPLFVNLIAGLTVAMAYPRAEELDAALEPLRLPATVLVLVLAGLMWVPPTAWWFWLFIPGYALLRFAARRVFSRVAVDTFVADSSLSVGVGRALLAQGVVAGAICVAFAQRFPEAAGVVTTTILGGMILSDAVAVPSLRRYLADMGELRPMITTKEDAS